ncbi:phytoene synthase [Halarchaeum rubridurum]|uniref:Geranylgeranyl-diphosphate geranylgeranyltransferase n=3 Tax=Halarchaeum TaxID=744724 RepID=A0A830G4Q1_9EURY|nr:phytoene/squalene synthase family protein [Halarchaeum rubridurum]MBP1955962.1 phytoene synthase [Halarchaeum rubridurum]GAD52390.1 phytoene synthase [Halarchaeum acidiphilum MH1-52-1]GGM75985.1 geranylgeranyl-diphosphate geranylgeranyltransferase [Halarchaeum rubridurum]
MIPSDDVATSKAIQQRTGKTFAVATRVLPKRARRATYVLYAFFRVADEVVDDPQGATPTEQRRDLARLRAAALGKAETDDPVLRAFRDLVVSYDISESEIETFLDAMEMDVDTRRYDTHEELETYLRGSAVAVGNMMLAVMMETYDMDAETVDRARPHAKALGEAFQLTNFLRDVREDVRDYDRIYLPRATLERHGVTEAEIRACTFSERFAAAMRAELRRTERLYREGVAGIRYLPEPCRFGVLCAAVLYADHHRLVRERGYDTLTARPTLSTPRRLSLTARTWYHWKRMGDPLTAFHAASDVPAVKGDRTERARRGDGVRTRARSVAASLSSLLGVGE